MSVLDWTGVSYPFRIENGSVATSQSTLSSKDGLSEHLSESIKIIISTNLGEWITNGDIGTMFRKVVFNNFSDEFDTYIIYKLTNAIESQDNRIKVAEINIVHEETSAIIKVAWDINPDIVQNYSVDGGTYNTDVVIPFTDSMKGGE